MTLFLNTRDDQYSRLGLEHFSNRFGLVSSRESPPPVIRFVDRQGEPDGTPVMEGLVRINGEDLPIFEVPPPLHHGEPLVVFRGGGREYPVAARDGADLVVSFDIFRQLGICFSGALESIWQGVSPGKKVVAEHPFCDQYMDWLFGCIRAEYHRDQLPMVSKTLWPWGQPYAVCLSHDVDEVRKTTQWFTYPARFFLHGDLRGVASQILLFLGFLRGTDPFWTFDEVMALEEGLGVRSSWYFLQESSTVHLLDRRTWRHLGRKYLFTDPRVSRLINELDSRGWEVGLHGSFSSFHNCELLASECSALEGVLGRPVTGCRQHNLNLDIPATWLCQQEAGIQYDTTLGFNDFTGFRWGTALPFRPLLKSGAGQADLLEIPLLIQDLPLFRGGAARDTFFRIASDVKKHRGVLTLLWHHPVFNEREYPGWGEAYREFIRYCQDDGAWFACGHDISRWWRMRERFSFRQEMQDHTLVVTPAGEMAGMFLDISLPPGCSPGTVRNGMAVGEREGCYTFRYTPAGDGESLEIDLQEACSRTW